MTNEEKILKLEKEVHDLKSSLSALLAMSTPQRLYLKNQMQFDKGSQVGFYGKEPVKQQTATDLATVITALKNYGLLTP